MKIKTVASIAAISLALLPAAYTRAQDAASAQANQGGSAAIAGQDEAMQMVAAQAYLKNKLNAKDAKPGSEFRAELSDSVQLKNGPKLPCGTALVGTVVSDDSQTAGTSKLALRFTQANLKDGKTIPIKATIVGVYGPESETAQNYNVSPGQQQANTWTPNQLKIDEVNVVAGADLHSVIGAQNSGVIVSKKENFKLSTGSEFALAIEAQGAAQSSRAAN
jgi:hypothetical protein